ncbi:MAG: SIALI-17 repeat-containing surface protein [Streptococcus sp.]
MALKSNDRLDHMVYLYYKTKLVNAIKDSTNPTNKIELKAESDGAVSYTKIQLVGGRGMLVRTSRSQRLRFPVKLQSRHSEFKGGIPGIPEVRELPEYTEPIGTVPNDAPKYEKPEFEGGVVPIDPPVVEIPEYTEPIGTVPNEAPVHDKPEFQGGIPGIPEVRELPPFEGGVIPNDAPILDLPELEIPVEPEKPSTPEKAPKTSVERPNNKVAQYTTVSYKLDSEPREGVNTPVYGGTFQLLVKKKVLLAPIGDCAVSLL